MEVLVIGSSCGLQPGQRVTLYVVKELGGGGEGAGRLVFCNADAAVGQGDEAASSRVLAAFTQPHDGKSCAHEIAVQQIVLGCHEFRQLLAMCQVVKGDQPGQQCMLMEAGETSVAG
jgi:hypothetical protein